MGGTSMIDGFVTRLNNETRKLVPQSYNLKILALPERLHSVWIGASILSTLSTFENKWMAKHEYEESGPAKAH